MYSLQNVLSLDYKILHLSNVKTGASHASSQHFVCAANLTESSLCFNVQVSLRTSFAACYSSSAILTEWYFASMLPSVPSNLIALCKQWHPKPSHLRKNWYRTQFHHHFKRDHSNSTDHRDQIS